MTFETGDQWLLDMTLDGGARGTAMDFRPEPPGDSPLSLSDRPALSNGR